MQFVNNFKKAFSTYDRTVSLKPSKPSSAFPHADYGSDTPSHSDFTNPSGIRQAGKLRFCRDCSPAVKPKDCSERRRSAWTRCCGPRSCSLPSCSALAFSCTQRKSGLFLRAKPTKAVNPSAALCAPQFYLQFGFSAPSFLTDLCFAIS